MSDSTTTEQAGGAQQPVPASDYRPTESLSAEHDAAPPPESTPEPAQAEAPHEQPQETDSERWERERKEYNRRLGQITRQKYAEKERAAALERRLAEMEARISQANGEPGQNGVPQDWMQHPQVRQAIEARAAEEARVQAFLQAGASEFPDWDKRRHDLIEMGADANMAQLLVEMPQGHRVAAALYDHPDELERIADLKTERARAVELGKFAARVEARRAASVSPQPPRRASSLPPPITPPATTRAKGEPDPEKGSMADYERWSKQQNWKNR
jgi:hypothetical protein